MKLLRWGLKLAGLTLLLGGLAVGALVLWLRHYVQTPEFAQDVKRVGSQLSGAEVSFDHLQWDIGRGLTVENVHLVRPGEEGSPEPAARMQAWQVILKYDWPSIWRRQFEITRLTFKSPRFVLRQQDSGDFLLPFAPPANLPRMPRAPIAAQLGAFNLDNGEVRILRRDGRPILEVRDFQAEGQRPNGGNGGVALTGAVHLARLVLWGKVVVNGLQSPYRYQDELLKMTSVQGELYGGRISGQWEQQLGNPEIPYSASLDIQGIDLGRLLAEAADSPDVMTGRLNLATTWLGPGNRPLNVAGEGSFEVSQGRVLNVPLFRELAARLPGLQVVASPDYESISGEYTLVDQQIQFRQLRFKSTLFEVAGEGTVTFDHRVRARLVLAVNPRLARQLPREASSLMETRSDQYKTFEVLVAGTLEAPQLSIPVSDAMRDQAWESLRRFLDAAPKPESVPAGRPD
ncbi:MAG: AsmA-like C-terminal region-containing protein [Verrucomicrobiota bacterium]